METNVKVSRECISYPGFVNSNGIFDKHDKKPVLSYALPRIELMIVVTFLGWQLIYMLLKLLQRYKFKRLAVMKFSVQITAGMLLSRTILHGETPFRQLLFPRDYNVDIARTIGGIGYIIFWFIMGAKMDAGMILRSAKRGIVIGSATTLIPMLVCYIIFADKMLMDSPGYAPDYLVTVVSNILSSFPVIASLLHDLKIQNSELGRLGLSAALLTDILGQIMNLAFSFVGARNIQGNINDLIGLVFFLSFVLFVFRPAMFWVIKNTPKGSPVHGLYIALIIILAFASGAYVHFFHQYLAWGPFFLGLALPHGPPLGSAIVEKFDCFNSGIFIPLVVATTVTNVDLFQDYNPWPLSIIILKVFMIKFLATFIPALMCKMALREALTLGLILNYQGIIDLVSYDFALEKKHIIYQNYNVLMLCFLCNTMIIPILVKLLYDPSRIYMTHEKRHVVQLKPDSELRIMSCIHTPDNIISTTKLLEALCPTKESPISVYVLHLIELIGQASPIFISHQHQTKQIGHHSYSDNVIVSFNRLQRDYWGLLNANIFASISLPKSMDEDICMVAFDKQTSVIVLPFHRTWSLDGSRLVSDNPTIRKINIAVLNKAPCSVGILADRSDKGKKNIGKENISSSSSLSLSDHSYQVCMVFFGGVDDREALALTKRMVNEQKLTLTVVRFLQTDNIGEKDATHWDSMLDKAILNDVKNNNCGDGYVIYAEERVKDGTELSKILRSMTSEYDLIVVGRSGGSNNVLTMGLEMWSEFQEMGIVGDLLVAPDLDSKASVLVIKA